MKKEKYKEFKKKIVDVMMEATFFLEIIISILVGIAVVLELLYVVTQFTGVKFMSLNTDTYRLMLKFCLDAVIGIEFMKLLYEQSINATLEVMIYALVRHLIINETSMLEALICAVAVAILFFANKYCAEGRKFIRPEE